MRSLPTGALVLLPFGTMLAAGAYSASPTPMGMSVAPQISPTRMELAGEWLGLRVADAQTAIARQWGTPPDAQGVMIVELAPGEAGARARAAGLLPGDLLVAADGNPIQDLASLYDVTRRVNAASVILLDVVRQGREMTLALPAPTTMSG